jgi:hypothetical protein
MLPWDPLVHVNQLVGLTALDTALSFLARALAMTYPDACRAPRADESAEVATARTLIEACERMQSSLESHRHQILLRLADA